MDIEEVRERKAKLEHDIEKLISKYEFESKCLVKSIYTERLPVWTGSMPYPFNEVQGPVLVSVRLEGL